MGNTAGGATWDHEAFREYVLQAAARLGLRSNADIIRSAGLNGATGLSKWLRGEVQPSRTNVVKLAEGLRVPRNDLLKLAGLLDDADLAISSNPVPPPATVHPLVHELGILLSDRSTLSREQQDELALFLDRLLASYRPQRRGGRTA